MPAGASTSPPASATTRLWRSQSYPRRDRAKAHSTSGADRPPSVYKSTTYLVRIGPPALWASLCRACVIQCGSAPPIGADRPPESRKIGADRPPPKSCSFFPLAFPVVVSCFRWTTQNTEPKRAYPPTRRRWRLPCSRPVRCAAGLQRASMPASTRRAGDAGQRQALSRQPHGFECKQAAQLNEPGDKVTPAKLQGQETLGGRYAPAKRRATKPPAAPSAGCVQSPANHPQQVIFAGSAVDGGSQRLRIDPRPHERAATARAATRRAPPRPLPHHRLVGAS